MTGPFQEREVGVRSARESLPTLLNTVANGHCVVHVTRHGKRVAAIVNTHLAQEIISAQEALDDLAIPGDLVGAIKMAESLLIDQPEAPHPDLKTIHSDPKELAGAAITLIDMMLTDAILGHGTLPIIRDDGTTEERTVADIIVRKLYRSPVLYGINPSLLPIMAGCIWSTQVGGVAAQHRLMIPSAVTGEEALAWLIALVELCTLINVIHGERTAENLMYEIEEHFREKHSASPWCSDQG